MTVALLLSLAANGGLIAWIWHLKGQKLTAEAVKIEKVAMADAKIFESKTEAVAAEVKKSL